MLKSIKRYFENRISPAEEGVTSQHATEESVRLATAALLIEALRADKDVTAEEHEMVTSAVRKTFDLSPEETAELVAMAEEEVAEATSFYQFTRLVDTAFSYDEKVSLVEHLWRVVFADAEMERREEHLVRRIADLLHVTHRDFIDAKLRVRDGR